MKRSYYYKLSLSESSLTHLMKIAIETEDKLTDSDLEAIVDIWNRKGRRVCGGIGLDGGLPLVVTLACYSSPG